MVVPGRLLFQHPGESLHPTLVLSFLTFPTPLPESDIADVEPPLGVVHERQFVFEFVTPLLLAVFVHDCCLTVGYLVRLVACQSGCNHGCPPPFVAGNDRRVGTEEFFGGMPQSFGEFLDWNAT